MIDLKKQLTRFTSGETAQKIIQNFAWLFFDKILRYAISMIVGIWLARYLAPAQYGTYNIAIALPAIFGTMASIGLRRITVRELVLKPKERDSILGSAFTLLSISGVFFWIFTTVFAAYFYQTDSTIFLLISIISLSFIFRGFETITYFFEAEMKLKYYVYATNIAFIISNIIKCILILLEAKLFAFAIVYVADIALTTVNLVIIFHQKGRSMFSWKYSISIAKQLFRDGSPLIFAGLMITINSKVDQIMLGKMRGNAEVGIYAVAVKLAELWFFIPNIIRTSIFPNLVESYASNSKKFHDKLEKILHLLCLFSYSVIIGTLLVGDKVVLWLYKDAYLEAVTALHILIFLVLFISLDTIKNSYLIIHNWTRLKLVFSIIAAGINVIANFILIPKYGMIGACYASLISYGISAYFATWLFPELNTLSRLMTRSLFLVRLRKMFF